MRHCIAVLLCWALHRKASMKPSKCAGFLLFVQRLTFLFLILPLGYSQESIRVIGSGGDSKTVNKVPVQEIDKGNQVGIQISPSLNHGDTSVAFKLRNFCPDFL